MGMLMGRALLAIAVGAVVLFTLIHVLFALPLWLLIGGVALYVWMRKGSGGRLLGRGRGPRGYLSSRSRW